MKCKVCGKSVPDNVIFCPDCGSRSFDYAEPGPTTEEKSSPVKEMLGSLFEKFSELNLCPQVISVLALAIVFFFLGFKFHSTIGIKKSDYDGLAQKNSELSASIDSLTQEKSEKERQYNEYKIKMHPYEELQAADAKAEADKAAAEAKVEQEAAQKAEEERKAAEEKKKAEKSIDSSEQSELYSRRISKNYKPSGNEPDWIELVSYCEVQMPKIIGYDASISLDENDTFIVKTGLRYKIETDKLKIKKLGSYHKAIFIIEFNDNTYDTYKFKTAEVAGKKYL